MGRQMRVWSLKVVVFRFFRSLSSAHFTYMVTRQLSRVATVDDLGDISRSLDCFASNFSRTVRDTAKVIDILVGNLSIGATFDNLEA